MSWKIIAWIFIVLFFSLLLFNAVSIYWYLSEEKALNNCYYNVCAEYPEATYVDGLCSCLDYDVLGELRVVKTVYK